MTENMQKQIAVGMSGGVDSSVTAYLLQKAGHYILGVTFSFFAPCGGVDNSGEAKRVASVLGIEHREADLSSGFYNQVISPFVEAYLQGETPNPCMLCNQGLKFSPLAIASTGLEHFATGHYARVGYDSGSGRYLLRTGKHLPKDQSYFLAGLSQSQLQRAVFPLGDYTKEEVRQIALEAELPTAHRSESQDICFIPDGDYVKFIKEDRGQTFPKGNFLDTQGKVLGEHQGILSYTVGQRRGLGVSSGGKLYVKEIRPQSNEVVLSSNEDLFSSVLYANRLNFVATASLTGAVSCEGKIRSRHGGAMAVAEQIGEDLLKVTFTSPQRAITPGQAVVLYDGDTVIVSGTILGKQQWEKQ